MSALTVVHLVRRENGSAPVQRFMAALHATTASAGHEFVLACKGFDDGDVKSYGKSRVIMLPDTGYDIGSYRRVAEQLSTEYVCFLNSWSRPLVSGWLPALLGAARDHEVGMAGCTGSFEQDMHVRTNAFCMRRKLFLDLVTSEPVTREDACAYEVGPRSITRMVLELGLRPVVVNASLEYRTAPWRDSNTFRWGGQRALLVADNRTDDWQHASPERRAMLQRLAWSEVEP